MQPYEDIGAIHLPKTLMKLVFVAMSADALFYQVLMDKKQNDSFVFNDKTFTIESVFLAFKIDYNE